MTYSADGFEWREKVLGVEGKLPPEGAFDKAIPFKIHLACGLRRPPGYIHVDIRESVRPDVKSVATDFSWICCGQEAAEVYICHGLEHMIVPKGALETWHEVLCYHGVLRISVPDMGAIFSAYHDFGVTLPRLAGLIWGRQDYPENHHYHGWDFETLANLLRECGYFDVKLWEPQEVFPEGYHDYSYAVVHTEHGDSISVSLNVEAKKI
jgi:predicted SAM-dependent methyltransferase